MIESGMYIDMEDFDEKFNAIVKDAVPEAAEKGIFDAMNELLNDAIEKPPQAPKDIGDLWGSRIVEKVEEDNKEMFIKGGFNIIYARRHHEVEPGTFEYTTGKGASQPGPKFLESKMAQFKDKYIEILTATIKRESE